MPNKDHLYERTLFYKEVKQRVHYIGLLGFLRATNAFITLGKFHQQRFGLIETMNLSSIRNRNSKWNSKGKQQYRIKKNREDLSAITVTRIHAISSYINDFKAIHLSDIREFWRQYSKHIVSSYKNYQIQLQFNKMASIKFSIFHLFYQTRWSMSPLFWSKSTLHSTKEIDNPIQQI